MNEISNCLMLTPDIGKKDSVISCYHVDDDLRHFYTEPYGGFEPTEVFDSCFDQMWFGL